MKSVSSVDISVHMHDENSEQNWGTLCTAVLTFMGTAYGLKTTTLPHVPGPSYVKHLSSSRN
jgi:hypothetical protein